MPISSAKGPRPRGVPREMTSAETQLDNALQGIDASSPSTTQLRPVSAVFAEVLDYEPDEVYAIAVSKAGNITKQARQSRRGERAKLLVIVASQEPVLAGAVRNAPKLMGPDWLDAAVVVDRSDLANPGVQSLIRPSGGLLDAAMQSAFPSVEIHGVTALHVSAQASAAQPGDGNVIDVAVVATPLIIDARIKRMLRLAIASSKAVMLVGPPGTGKSTLIDEALAEIEAAPQSYGLSHAPSGVRDVTPEEGWTARDLVGGETVDDDGNLRFRPGHVLEAIRDDEWLVLDEANRADMDKIFGGLLTFLSNKPVTLGRASNDLKAANVRLEWGPDSVSSCPDYHRLEDGQGSAIRFFAGHDWRLLGTYNALDAQRVFRFGQALGRRFQRVPVQPISSEDFAAALQPHLEQLPEAVDVDRVGVVLRALYDDHQLTPPQLGPAVFLGIPRYIVSGLSLIETEEFIESATDEEGDGESSSVGSSISGVSLAVDELLVEGYLLGVGSWLAQLGDSERDEFHARVVTESELLTEAQWAFITEHISALA